MGVNDTTEVAGLPPSRSRRPLAIVAVLAVLVIGAAAAVYATFFNDDAPARLALSDQPAPTSAPAPTTAGAQGGATPTTAGGSDLAGTWRAVAGSEAGYRVREKLAALAAKSDAVGRSTAVTGSVKVDRTGSSFSATEATFEVDLTKLVSDDTRRDNRIRSEGLQSTQFPKATFVSTKAIALPAETGAGQAVKATIEGDLTLHGVTKRVTIPLDIRVTGGKGELVGSLGFPMSDFNITPPSIGNFVTVDPDATLEFKLLLEKG